MISVNDHIEIRATRRRVFSLISDPGLLAEWMEISHSLEQAPAQPLRRGAAFEQTLDLSGARVRIRWEATRVRRPDAIVWTAEGPSGSRAVLQMTLSTVARGRTLVVYSCDLHPPGGPLGLVAERLFGGDRAARQAREAFHRVRSHLEGANL